MYLNNFKQVVIKIGSSLLMDDKKNIRKKWLLEFAKDINLLIKNKKKVITEKSKNISSKYSWERCEKILDFAYNS